jgi:hypothetical protein
MPELTRRRSLDAPDECWHIYYGDVRAGTIAIRTGMPPGEDPWGWNCGFYPGSHPRECTDGTAPTFDQARVEFEDAWREFLSNRTEADFQAWRDERDWTARKYALWDAGKRLEPPSYAPGKPCGRFRKCACGDLFDMHCLEENVMHVPHITATEAATLALQSGRPRHNA